MKNIYTVFELDGDICAINIGNLHQIIEVESMVKTGTDELNVVRWENKSLPVIDPIALVSFSTHRMTTKSRVIIIEKENMEFGVLVNDVIGVIEIKENQIEEPGIKDPRYVVGIHKDIKLFDPQAFLTKKMTDNFQKVYRLRLEHLDAGTVVNGEKTDGDLRIVENIRMISLNWIIKASKYESVNPALVSEAAAIHNLASQLKKS